MTAAYSGAGWPATDVNRRNRWTGLAWTYLKLMYLREP